MTFVVTLIALLIERFFDWSHMRRFTWYQSLQQMMMNRFTGLSSYFILAATIVPVLVAALLISLLLDKALYGLLSLLFQLLILLYCFGPRNLWANTFASLNVLTQGDAQSATNNLKTTFNIDHASSVQELHQQLTNHLFIEANRRIFAVIFWYVLLGPVGALLYRCVSLSATESTNQEISYPITPGVPQAARLIESILDWIPVRILTFIFALGGQFSQVFNVWYKKVLLGPAYNQELLVRAGTAAIHQDDVNKEDGALEKQALKLLDRSFVIVLVIVAVLSVVV